MADNADCGLGVCWLRSANTNNNTNAWNVNGNNGNIGNNNVTNSNEARAAVVRIWSCL